MKALYFAWVREKIGKAEEEISPPGEIATVGELIAWLSRRGEEYHQAFATGTVRVALDRAHVKHDAAISKAAEIAFFSADDGRLKSWRIRLPARSMCGCRPRLSMPPSRPRS